MCTELVLALEAWLRAGGAGPLWVFKKQLLPSYSLREDLSLDELEKTLLLIGLTKRLGTKRILENVETVYELCIMLEKTVPEETLKIWVKEMMEVQRKLNIIANLMKEALPCYVLIFPGQGTQEVGMSSDLQPHSPGGKLFQKASHYLGYDLLDLCVHGPKEILDRTDRCQVAVYVSSLAALAQLKEREPNIIRCCNVTCGLSVGELASLVVAEVLSFEDGLQLVERRGRAMQHAVNMHPRTAMMSVLGLNLEEIQTIINGLGTTENQCSSVQISNILSSSNIVISGTQEDCEEVREILLSHHNCKVIPLKVAGAFHSHFMQPAVRDIEEVISKITFHPPKCMVISNVTAKPVNNIEEIKVNLLKHLTSPVLWHESIKNIIESNRDKGKVMFYEVGPGNVLSGLILREIQNNKSLEAVVMVKSTTNNPQK